MSNSEYDRYLLAFICTAKYIGLVIDNHSDTSLDSNLTYSYPEYVQFTACKPVKFGTEIGSIFNERQAIRTLRVVLFEFPLQCVILIGGHRQ